MKTILDQYKVIVHDCKNHNSVIVNCAELLKEELLRCNSPFSKYCDSIIKSVGMVSSTVNTLVDNESKNGFQSVDVHSIIADVLNSFGRVLNTELDIRMNLRAFSCRISGDQVALYNALANLILNAWESMEGYSEKPVLTVSTDNVVVKRDPEGSLLAKKYLKISIGDNGRGISNEDQRKLFKFNFSTKVKNSTRGVGLSSVNEAINAHGGHVYLENSVLGKGAIFSVLIPLSHEKVYAN